MTDTRALPAAIEASEDRGPPARSLWQRFDSVILGTGSIVILLLAWEFLPRVFTLSAGTKLFFTTPSQVAGTLWQMFATGTIWAPLGVSASGFTIGLALSIVVG